MSNLMCDLETFGNRERSVITSVGAVVFGDNGLGAEFYERIDPETCVDVGLEMDASTILWWLKQSDGARLELTKEGKPVSEVLERLSSFIKEHKTKCVWGNGASFDNTILSSAYHACKKKQPWQFWNDRCYRTIKAMYPDVTMKRSGTHHNALDDAKSQAQHLLDIAKKHNLKLGENGGAQKSPETPKSEAPKPVFI